MIKKNFLLNGWTYFHFSAYGIFCLVFTFFVFFFGWPKILLVVSAFIFTGLLVDFYMNFIYGLKVLILSKNRVILSTIFGRFFQFKRIEVLKIYHHVHLIVETKKCFYVMGLTEWEMDEFCRLFPEVLVSKDLPPGLDRSSFPHRVFYK